MNIDKLINRRDAYIISNGILPKCLFVLFAAMCIYISTLSFDTVLKNHAPIYMLFAIMMVLCILLVMYIRIKPTIFMILLCIASLVVKVCFCNVLQATPVSDFLLLYETANEAAQGYYGTLNQNPYFYNWAYQSGFVAWMAFFIKYFHANVFFFMLTNCVFSTGTTLLVYFFVKAIMPGKSGEKPAQIAAMLYLCYPGAYVLLPVLTNQHISNFLLFAAVYVFYARKGKRIWTSFTFAGILAALGDIMRPVGSVVLIALLGVTVLETFFVCKLKSYKQLRIIVGGFLLFCLIYLVVLSSASSLVKASGLNENGLKNNFPEWKFVLGLNAETQGGYSDDDLLLFAGMSSPERSKAAKTVIKERIPSGPSAALTLFDAKSHGMWGNFDATGWAFGDYREQSLHFGPITLRYSFIEDVLRRLSANYYCIIFLLAACGSLLQLRQKAVMPIILVLCAIAVLYFGVHLFIEIQQRYRDFIFTAIFPLAALPLRYLYPSVKRPS